MSRRTKRYGEACAARPRLYTGDQIELLRQGTRRFYLHASTALGRYSWPAFAQAVRDHFQDLTAEQRTGLPKLYCDLTTVSFDDERLRVFVEGVSNPKNSLRRFPTPEDKLLLALDLYLTDPDNDYSRLSRDELHGGNWVSMASLLSRFFAYGVDEVPRISHVNLTGRFRSSAHIVSAVPPLLLIIEEAPHDDRVLSATLTVDADAAAEANFPVATYMGWIVVTPEDSLVALLKDKRTQQNHFLLSLAVDAAIYDGAQTGVLVFLRHSLPMDIDTDELGGPDFLDRWLRHHGSKILILKRES